MEITDKLNNFIQKMKWYDVSLIKLSVFFATLFLITVWSWFRNIALSVEWYWYLILMIIFMTPLLKKLFSN